MFDPTDLLGEVKHTQTHVQREREVEEEREKGRERGLGERERGGERERKRERGREREGGERESKNPTLSLILSTMDAYFLSSVLSVSVSKLFSV